MSRARQLVTTLAVLAAVALPLPSFAQTQGGLLSGLPDKCFKQGDCSVDDIIHAGVNFASLLMGLAGGLFLIIFIYGGAIYLLSGGNSDKVKKASGMIKGAAFGIIIVMAAWTIVQTLVKAITPVTPEKASGVKKTCEDLGAGYSCVPLTGATAQAALQDAASKNLTCQTGYCPGSANILCCTTK